MRVFVVIASIYAAATGCVSIQGGGSTTNARDPQPTGPMWTGFVEIGSLGLGCTAALASEHVFDLASGTESSGQALATPNLPGYSTATFLGYAQKYLWFAETTSSQTITKILRVMAP